MNASVTRSVQKGHLFPKCISFLDHARRNLIRRFTGLLDLTELPCNQVGEFDGDIGPTLLDEQVRVNQFESTSRRGTTDRPLMLWPVVGVLGHMCVDGPSKASHGELMGLNRCASYTHTWRVVNAGPFVPRLRSFVLSRTLNGHVAIGIDHPCDVSEVCKRRSHSPHRTHGAIDSGRCYDLLDGSEWKQTPETKVTP